MLVSLKALRKHPVVDLVLTLVVAIAIAYGVQAWIVKPYRIPSESMVDTCRIGDRVLAARFLYRFKDPERGDIIVFHPNGKGSDAFLTDSVADAVFVKRLIGMPGEWIGRGRPRADLQGARNGNGCRARSRRAVRVVRRRTNFGPFKIPAGKLLDDGRQPRRLRRLAHLGHDHEGSDDRARVHDLLAAHAARLLLAGGARRRRGGATISRMAFASEPGVDLYWLPLGAGGHSVRLNGRVFEAVAALLARRPRCDLYHSALVVRPAETSYVIEMAPVRDGRGAARGVVGEGAVGSRWAGRFRIFRYEIRRWPGGVIPDVDEAVGSPQRLSIRPGAGAAHARARRGRPDAGLGPRRARRR